MNKTTNDCISYGVEHSITKEKIIFGFMSREGYMKNNRNSREWKQCYNQYKRYLNQKAMYIPVTPERVMEQANRVMSGELSKYKFKVNDKKYKICLPTNCIVCGLLTQSLCKGCRQVYYCNVQCQKIDWKNGHKNVCKKSLI